LSVIIFGLDSLNSKSNFLVLVFSHRLACGIDVLRLPAGSESRNYTIGNIMKNNNPDKRSKKSLFDYYSKLARTILNSLSANISILDENGVILETNEAWKNFAMKN